MVLCMRFEAQIWPVKSPQGDTSGAHISAISEVASVRQLLLVGLHEQLNSALPDLQGGHVRQEVIAHKEAHEDCKRGLGWSERGNNMACTGCDCLWDNSPAERATGFEADLTQRCPEFPHAAGRRSSISQHLVYSVGDAHSTILFGVLPLPFV